MLGRLQNWFGGSNKHARSARRDRKVSLAVETLEGRSLMATYLGPTAPITDMTDLAERYATPDGPTMLFLNFDGDSSNNAAAFTGSANDIQEILFRTSEIFAPFNVQVERIFGDGSFDSSSNGNSTVFIGDDSDNNTFSPTGAVINQRYAGTAPQFADYASANRPEANGTKHRINSDPFDLAYVDPWNGFANQSNLAIARTIAHEAGHTFGLAHVLSSPVNEVMSYDATAAAFVNTTFNITNLNNPGDGINRPTPSLQPVWYWYDAAGNENTNNIVTQNSYTTLAEVLGMRSTTGDVSNVADRDAVDPGWANAYVEDIMPVLSVASSRNDVINRLGDYDVFSFTAGRTGSMRVEVEGINGSSLMPTILVYRPDTEAFITRQIAPGGAIEATFQATAGVSYRFIVGAANCRTTGEYRISVDAGGALGANPTLDIQALAGSQNGVADYVELQTYNSHFKLLVGSQVVFSDRVEDLQSVTVRGTSDDESIRIGSAMPFAVTINGGLGWNRLYAPDTDNHWSLTGHNMGSLNTSTSFSAITHLLGGYAKDTFRFGFYGSVSGRVYGQDGVDTLDYSGRTSGIVVNLATNSATSIQGGVQGGISSIENVKGGAGVDQITGNSSANSLWGGGGNDTLRGGGGNDHLYGEAGADWLYGEGGTDYLDGGYDQAIDWLFGDNEGAPDEPDVIFNHLFWNGRRWMYEDALQVFGAADTLVPIVH